MLQTYYHYTKNFITAKAKINVENNLNSNKIFNLWWLNDYIIEICHNRLTTKK